MQCDPGSSSMFAMGETAVRCTATDAEMAQASCEFGVTVRVSRTIAKTKFMAFGDSITDGAVSLAPLIMLGPPDTYPFKLEQLLLERYPSQPIVVVNEGKGGEDTRGGARRLPGVLDADKPEVLLLLEGINNLGASKRLRSLHLPTMITEASSWISWISRRSCRAPTWKLTTDTMQRFRFNSDLCLVANSIGVPVDL